MLVLIAIKMCLWMPYIVTVKRPVSLGGDHFVTGGILQALGGPQSKLIGSEPACILHFDSHTDCFSNMETLSGGQKISSPLGFIFSLAR